MLLAFPFLLLRLIVVIFLSVAHTIMVMIMSNVSIDMVDHGFSFEAAALVMEIHFAAMFVPGFFSGLLIEKQGTFFVALVGGLIFAASSLVLAIRSEDWNFMLGMALLGVAWNFSFSAGTLMLTHCYKPIEATEVQAVNDFILFTVAGGGSLVSGIIYSAYGSYYISIRSPIRVFLIFLLTQYPLYRLHTYLHNRLVGFNIRIICIGKYCCLILIHVYALSGMM